VEFVPGQMTEMMRVEMPKSVSIFDGFSMGFPWFIAWNKQLGWFGGSLKNRFWTVVFYAESFRKIQKVMYVFD